MNNNRFGKSSEKLDTENQICFMEVDGNIVFFNEAEAVASLDEYVDEDETRPRGRKTKGRREKDIQGAPCKSGGTQDVRRRTHCRVW
ncbi:hypothetical protein [Roseburia intestinalis]|uniref:hypothetical protein n=1 Tax=Roseburia intestinalis TaxID=166486 RepID=UPI002E8E452B|nr:hypothetical protein [Roseburia intestinalis]